MTLLNYTVYCRLSKEDPASLTNSVCSSSISHLSVFLQPNGCHMDQVHVGKTKEALDQVDPSLTIVDVTSVFGNFVKFTITEASASGLKEVLK